MKLIDMWPMHMHFVSGHDLMKSFPGKGAAVYSYSSDVSQDFVVCVVGVSGAANNYEDWYVVGK
jgi:hypothetical protein